jgi:hypothetical protein
VDAAVGLADMYQRTAQYLTMLCQIQGDTGWAAATAEKSRKTTASIAFTRSTALFEPV